MVYSSPLSVCNYKVYVDDILAKFFADFAHGKTLELKY